MHFAHVLLLLLLLKHSHECVAKELRFCPLPPPRFVPPVAR